MLIDFQCEKCQTVVKKYFKSHKDIPKELVCLCEGKLLRLLGSPTSKSTQIIDNGLQTRQVEILNEIVEEERERATKC
jgi:hypothetical protein